MLFFSNLWNRSFKFQLIYGFGFILTALIITFTYINISYQSEFLKETGMKQIFNRSLSLAKASRVWVMSNDYEGLSEVIHDYSLYDDLEFAAIISMEGKVIGHTDDSFVGKYIADEKRIKHLKDLQEHKLNSACTSILQRNTKSIDILRSIHEGKKHVAFVHMRIDQSVREEAINEIISKGIVFTVISILIGITFAYLVANGLTKRLSSLMRSIKSFRDGDKSAVADASGVKEIAKLASEFNNLTHTLNQAEDLNKKLTERLELAFIATQDGLWDWDVQTDEIYYSPIWKNLIGYEDNELIDNVNTWESRVHPDDLEKVLFDIDEHIKGHTREYKNEHRLLHKKGHWIWTLDRGKALFDVNGVAIRMVGTHTDITKEKAQREAHQHVLEYQAHHDALTSLPNRLLFHDRLMRAIEKAKRHNRKLAIFFIDLDRFKQINDSLGHDIGDKVLQMVSDRLMMLIRKEDTLARLGGDEFCILMEELNKSQDASFLAEKILKVLVEPMYIDRRTLYVSSSIGISLYPEDDTDATSLLKYADAAMYKAKEEGRDTFQFYSSEMTELATEHIALESSLREALKRDEFMVYYQSQIDGRDNSLTGMEALVRWNNPALGLVSPAKFIPLAEETGLILALDQWVMKTAMLQFAQWYKEGLNPGRLALNLAMKQLRDKDFIIMLQDMIKETNFKPEWLALEVTEGQIMSNPDQAIIILREISEMGVELAVDDFGTGYSSLTYLKRLPINKLKIDQSFIRDLPDDEEDIGITKSVIALSESLNLDVIAEGVETEEQKDFLVANGCHNIQGYYYCKPMPADEMQKRLNKNI